MSMFARLKAFDVYRKLPQDLTEPTMSGAIVSIASTLIMLILFLTEFNEFLKVRTVSEMFIDTNKGGEKLVVNIDISMPHLPCDLASFDAQDVMGSHHLNIGGDLRKRRLSADGTQGEEIRHGDGDTNFNLERANKAFQDKEGCRFYGTFSVNKVPGNFHVSSHAYMDHVNVIFSQNGINTIDLSHNIHHISFGEDKDLKLIKTQFDQGALNPLDNVQKMKTPAQATSHVMYQYYISVVPTTYEDLKGKQIYVHQFTANNNEIEGGQFPGLFFRYDLSPVTVKFSLTKESFFRFLVQICAIIGGIFTVAGIIDAILHKSVVNILKKAQIGKLG